jgi:hypothetical protein
MALMGTMLRITSRVLDVASKDTFALKEVMQEYLSVGPSRN